MWPPAQHRRWLILNSLVVTALINAATTAGIGALTVPSHGMDAWSWRHTSTIVDGLVTLVTLPAITTVLVTLFVRRERSHQRLERLPHLTHNHPWVAMLPSALLLRAAAAAAVTFAMFWAPVAAGLAIAGDMGATTFVAYKACFAVVLGAIVTPALALRAMAEPGSE